MIRTKSKKWSPNFEYHKGDVQFSIRIPDDVTFPLTITIGASLKSPNPKAIESLIGGDEAHEAEAKKGGIKLPKFKLPHITAHWPSFGGKWMSALFGVNVKGGKIPEAKPVSDLASLTPPNIKLKLSLHAEGSIHLEPHTPSWKLHIVFPGVQKPELAVADTYLFHLQKFAILLMCVGLLFLRLLILIWV